MATPAQIEANRRNAQLSTGPTSPDGKVSSSRNSSRHGMAGEGSKVEGVTDSAFAERYAGFAATYRPRGEYAVWVLEQTVAASFRLDLCRAALDADIRKGANRAATAWDIDRETEAGELHARLGRDPVRFSRRLRSTPQGCELMTELWNGLAAALESTGEWTEGQVSMALDLLGVSPELRDGRTPIDPLEGDAANHRLALCRAESDKLAGRAETLAPIDEMERAQTVSGVAGLLAKSAGLILRYERDAWRQFERGIAILKRLAEGDPAPIALPAPRPPAPPRAAPPAHRPVPPAAEAAAPRREQVVAARPNPARPAPAPSPARPIPAQRPAYSYVDIAITPTPA